MPRHVAPQQDWAGCSSMTIAPEQSSSSEMSTKVTGLNPSSSYIFRLYTVTADGQEVGPGPEIAFDTEGRSASKNSFRVLLTRW